MLKMLEINKVYIPHQLATEYSVKAIYIYI